MMTKKRFRAGSLMPLQSTRRLRCFLFAVILIPSILTELKADLVLETETAQLGKQGEGLISTAIQFERDKDGGTTAFTLNQFEYAITDRSEILIEPFFYEWDNPADGSSFGGVGDLEITPSYMMVREQGVMPAIVLAFKLKVPTATNRDIGTGRFDYQPFVIIGETYGPWIFNENFGIDFVTSPPDEPLHNQLICDFSVERKITDNWSVFAEVFANTSPARGESNTYAGALATEYKLFAPPPVGALPSTEAQLDVPPPEPEPRGPFEVSVFASVGDDSDRLLALRTGFNIEF